jgi:uncharacterized protein (DUF433 family)
MNASVDIGTLIIRTPGLKSGRPHIAGTGVTVQRIAGWFNPGFSAEEIASKLPHLSMKQVYAALAYYFANRQEVENYLRQEEEDYKRLSKEENFTQR